MPPATLSVLSRVVVPIIEPLHVSHAALRVQVEAERDGSGEAAVSAPSCLDIRLFDEWPVAMAKTKILADR